jgi:hypothetical protein
MFDRSDSSDDESATAETSSRVSRRVVIGTAAWSAPVIAVATAAPAFAASGATTINRTNPNADFFKDTISGNRALSVTLLNGAAGVGTKTIQWAFSGSWGAVAPTSTTNSSGVATNSLIFSGAAPAEGATANLTATYQDLVATWVVTYRALTLAEAISATYKNDGLTHRVRALVTGHANGGSPTTLTRKKPFTLDTNLVLSSEVSTTSTVVAANNLYVNLSTTALRTTAGLATNPTRDNDLLEVTGTAAAYFGQAGINPASSVSVITANADDEA